MLVGVTQLTDISVPNDTDVRDAVVVLQAQVQADKVTVPVVGGKASCATGDGQGVWFVPSHLAGKSITAVLATTSVAGVTGTMDVQVRNHTQAADVLSTVITIDTAELDSSTAATPAVIDVTEDDLTEGDEIRVDVDAVHSGTAAVGLWVVLTIG